LVTFSLILDKYTTIWLFNIAMKIPYKWRFIAGKIIYKWAIYTMAMLVITRGYTLCVSLCGWSDSGGECLPLSLVSIPNPLFVYSISLFKSWDIPLIPLFLRFIPTFSCFYPHVGWPLFPYLLITMVNTFK
jgi:hypothetical protein